MGNERHEMSDLAYHIERIIRSELPSNPYPHEVARTSELIAAHIRKRFTRYFTFGLNR